MNYFHGFNGNEAGAAAYRAVGTLGTLLGTVPTRRHRPAVFIQNQSAADIVAVLYASDDTTVIGQVILTGTGALAQGGEWSSAFGPDAFIGKIEVYGASGAAVCVLWG